MNYSLTVFESIYDNKTHRKMEFPSWDAFRKTLFELSKRPGYKPGKDDWKKGSELISPAFYDEGTTRANANVRGWGGWIALDVDDFACSFEEALMLFKEYEHVVYSSASSTKEKPKFRVVLPCTEFIKAEDIKHFWFAINKEFDEMSDPQTKDMSRLYYIPADYPNSYRFIFHNRGKFVEPRAIMNKWKYMSPMQKRSLESGLSEEMLKKVAAYKMGQLTNRDISWTGYRDCPFVHDSMIKRYLSLSTTGWYTALYKLMVAIAGEAVKKNYPIRVDEVEALVREIDSQSGNWYQSRPIDVEAKRAIDYVLGL